MRVSLHDLLNALGVGYEMGPYETCPWSVYGGDKGVTCNAEVRMNEDASLCEAEVMLIYDVPPAGGAPIDLVFHLYCKPTSGQWEPFKMIVRGNDLTGGQHDWAKRGCDFFLACVQELKMEQLPDIEELLKKIDEDGDGGTNMRGGGSKAPKIKPQALLGMKGGRGF